MCIESSFIWVERGPNFEKIQKSCGSCWRCRSNKVNDYIGRSLCEAHKSDWVMTLTLTYAPRNDGAEKHLNIEHFQKFVRSLRRRGHKIRYLVAGEYGSLQGRSHFHVLLFGIGSKPRVFLTHKRDGPLAEIPDRERAWWPSWAHGHVFADLRGGEKQIRYVCKYVHKDGDQAWFSCSKKPALGVWYFVEKATQEKEAGLWPSGFEYMPPNGTRKRKYLMTGAARRDYLWYRMFLDGMDVVTQWETASKGRNEYVGLALQAAAKSVARADYSEDLEWNITRPMASVHDCPRLVVQRHYTFNGETHSVSEKVGLAAETMDQWHVVELIGALNGQMIVYNPIRPDVIIHPKSRFWTGDELFALDYLFHALSPVRRWQKEPSLKLRQVSLPWMWHANFAKKFPTHYQRRCLDLCVDGFPQLMWKPVKKQSVASLALKEKRAEIVIQRREVLSRGVQNDNRTCGVRSSERCLDSSLAEFW